LAGGVTFATSRVLTTGWLSFILNIIVFCGVYGVSLLLFGFKKEEKQKIPVIGKFLR
jgi:hypothetical protein